MNVYLSSSPKNSYQLQQLSETLKLYNHHTEYFRTNYDPSTILRNIINVNTFISDYTKNFQQNKQYIESSDVVIMVMPADEISHTELGYAKGIGKRAFIYYPHSPMFYMTDEFKLIYGIADLITNSLPELLDKLVDA